MTSEQLAASVASVVAEAQGRIVGVGHEQYAEEDGQKFERMPLDDLINYYREELLDIVNYAVMTVLRLDRIQAGVGEALRARGYEVAAPPKLISPDAEVSRNE